MQDLLHELIIHSAGHYPDREALRCKGQGLDYQMLLSAVQGASSGFIRHGLRRGDRVAIYLPKQPEAVCAIFGTSMAGGIFVPMNPLLKPEQVGHILRDCNASFLVTSLDRYWLLRNELANCTDIHTVVLVSSPEPEENEPRDTSLVSWETFCQEQNHSIHRTIDSDVAAILYTSGSTGRPKGVVLSQRNLVAGAKSVASYLGNHPDDRILAVLPFSFDYGFSQLTTAFLTGACAVLMDYLLPRDVIRTIKHEKITGLAAVPPLWVQLANLDWPDVALRYMTNSGGAMPQESLTSLRKAVPDARFFLMYGLTEAFRSTYLPPEQLDKRPDSIGKAIPNAEILVINDEGQPCKPGETGELVHRGVLVARGYWNDPDRTAVRFRHAPETNGALALPEVAVWSGDYVRMDDKGYLYFIGRKDDMIKTSGYRVSPTEIEEVIYRDNSVEHAAAFGIPHPVLGQAIVVAASPKSGAVIDISSLMSLCKQDLPTFMLPQEIKVLDKLPTNPNGKIDRKRLLCEFQRLAEQPDP